MHMRLWCTRHAPLMLHTTRTTYAAHDTHHLWCTRHARLMQSHTQQPQHMHSNACCFWCTTQCMHKKGYVVTMHKHLHNTCTLYDTQRMHNVCTTYAQQLSHVPYERVRSHMNESCPIWTSHVACERVMSHRSQPPLTGPLFTQQPQTQQPHTQQPHTQNPPNQYTCTHTTTTHTATTHTATTHTIRYPDYRVDTTNVHLAVACVSQMN